MPNSSEKGTVSQFIAGVEIGNQIKLGLRWFIQRLPIPRGTEQVEFTLPKGTCVSIDGSYGITTEQITLLFDGRAYAPNNQRVARDSEHTYVVLGI